MALIAIASDKGAPGVTTAALALAAVWPRPVLLAECDPAGGDLVYRFPAAGGGHLDPRRGVLSLAVIARRGMAPHQVWEHAQKLHGGLDVLAGVTNAEQGAGLSLLWGPIGKVLASLPQADVIADCGRLGADGPLYDLLAEATTVVLVSRVHVADVIRLRDRATAFAAAAQSRGRRGFGVGVVVVADHKKLRASLGEVQQVLAQANAPAAVLGGIAYDTKGADLLSGEWGGSLDRTLLIKTAREVAQHLVHGLPPIGSPATANPAAPNPATASPAASRPPTSGSSAVNPQAVPSAAAPPPPVPAASSFSRSTSAAPAYAGPGSAAPSYAGPGSAAPSYAGPGSAAPSYAGPGSAAPAYAHPRSAAPSYAGPVPTVPSHARPAASAAQALAPSAVTDSQQSPDSSQASRPAAEVATGMPVAESPGAGTSATGVAAGRRGSPAGPRTAFTRVLGSRSGRHQADPGQGGRTSDAPADASSAAEAPDQAPDPAQAQVAYVSAPTTSTPATSAPAQLATPRPASPQPAYLQAANPQAAHAQAAHAQVPSAQPATPQAAHAQVPSAQPANPQPASPQAASAHATGADPGRPAARHAQQTARPATDAPGYSRTPMSPLRPGDAGFLAGGYQDSDFQDSRSQVSDFQDSDFQDSRSQVSDFQDSRSQHSDFRGDISWPSDAQDSRFPAVDFQAGYASGASRQAPEPVEAEPAAAPADRPDSPVQDDSGWGSSQWDTAPGPMGSRRPGRG